MKISIIIPVKNGAKTIRQAIDSILSQKYEDIELIIVNGVSSDDTTNIISSYEKKITHFISGNDKNMYDAINKGIHISSGEIIAVLNSDDMYMDNMVIASVVETFKTNTSAGIVYGNLIYVNKNNLMKIKRIWKSEEYVPGLFKKGWHPPHPSFFVRKDIYKKYGLYRADLSIASDYEMMLRLLEIKKVSSIYIPKILVKMRLGGMSNKSLFSIIKANLQSLRAWKLNGQKIPYLIFFKKPFSKLWQKR